MNEVLGELRATLGREGATGVVSGAQVECADGTEVPCIRRWEEVWVKVDDRIKGFRCDA